ncbi:hypothetical protein EV421DRAFT_1442878 [Armillaria borealis]|uniref:Uncharacterized protein n=1 Tax=Armillaria borealis TaxID=47425 RepID=A0AA39IZ33_9AGAR|nr:hypothetical protein EV421DRAFT_1442878 [Armillaria borealis]
MVKTIRNLPDVRQPQKRNIGKKMFLWVRYYSIALLLFDTVRIHVFSTPRIEQRCSIPKVLGFCLVFADFTGSTGASKSLQSLCEVVVWARKIRSISFRGSLSLCMLIPFGLIGNIHTKIAKNAKPSRISPRRFSPRFDRRSLLIRSNSSSKL